MNSGICEVPALPGNWSLWPRNAQNGADVWYRSQAHAVINC